MQMLLRTAEDGWNDGASDVEREVFGKMGAAHAVTRVAGHTLNHISMYSRCASYSAAENKNQF